MNWAELILTCDDGVKTKEGAHDGRKRWVA